MNCVQCYVAKGRYDVPATYVVKGESCCEEHMHYFTQTQNRSDRRHGH